MLKVRNGGLQSLIERYGNPETDEKLFDIVHSVIDDHLPDGIKVLGLAWNVNYTRRMSCTHCSPSGQMNNWASDNDRPTHFPGWSGRVWVRLNKMTGHGRHPNISSLFSQALTYTGTGGFGSYEGPWRNISHAKYMMRDGKSRNHEVISYSWDYKIWDSDFPLIAQNIIKHQLLTMIKDTSRPNIPPSCI